MRCHVSHGSGPCLSTKEGSRAIMCHMALGPAKEGSGADTCPAAPDPVSQPRRALVLPCVPQLRTPPPH
jgi:hypothetical protein